MFLAKHFPILQILIPFFGALLCAFSNNYSLARIIAIIIAIVNFLLSLLYFSSEISYNIGNWTNYFGIEYKIDKLNHPFIIYVNGVLVFFLLFCHEFIKKNILEHIAEKRIYLFYTILLFAHAGYLGILCTKDLFNLYVFIEISSLSTYILMSLGGGRKSAIGAFDYLMLGTIGATLILIGIGFLLANTGSLNISDIQIKLEHLYDSKIILVGISFFIIGSILKTAFFPIHFWMVRAYNFSPTIIITYIASISGIIGSYIILRFFGFGDNSSYIYFSEIIDKISIMLQLLSLLTIFICSIIAFTQADIKRIIIYSAAAQIGYVILLIVICNSASLISKFLIADSINKIGLFLLLVYMEESIFFNFEAKIYASIILLASAGLPLSNMFFMKINILEILLYKNLFLEFTTIILASIFALLYHYRIAKYLLLENQISNNHKNIYSLMFIATMQIISPFLLFGIM